MNMTHTQGEAGELDRRELLKLASTTFFGLMTATEMAAMPEELAANVARDPNWKPVFLSPAQTETITVLTELIIPRTDTPGANDAKVHRYIDLFLSVASPADQQRYRAGLTWLDEYAQQNHKKTFVKCNNKQRMSLVTSMAGMGGAGGAKVPDEGRSFFDRTKRMTSSIYFATAEGQKELQRFGPAPPSVGCEHTGGHTGSA